MSARWRGRFGAPSISAPASILTPVNQPHVTSVLATPGLAARFIQAVERGSQVNIDPSDGGDYWPFFSLPLEETRRRLNVVPERPSA